MTPLNNMFRRAVADDRIGDQPVERGDRIIMLYPSANRDEDVFADPFRFDIRRSPNPHIAFGFGTHLCIGTHVARATLASVFAQMSRRMTDLRVVTEPDVERNIFARPSCRSASASAAPNLGVPWPGGQPKIALGSIPQTGRGVAQRVHQPSTSPASSSPKSATNRSLPSSPSTV